MGAHANIGTGQISTTMQGSMAALKGLEVRVFHGETDELIRGDWCVTLTPPSPVSRAPCTMRRPRKRKSRLRGGRPARAERPVRASWEAERVREGQAGRSCFPTCEDYH